MSRSKTISTVLALAGAGLLAWAAVSWNRNSKDVDRWTAKLGEEQAHMKATRAELHSNSLQYQAFMKSLVAVPDSIKQASAQVMRDTERRYEGTIRKLEVAERNLELDVHRSKRKVAEAEEARRRAALPFAGGGAAAWLCAALVAGLSRSPARKPRKAA